MELPIVVDRTLDNGTRLIVFNYRDVTEEALVAATNMDDTERKVIERYTNINRRKEWIAVRYFLQNEFGFSDCKIVYDETGKPSLKNPDMNISISHSSGLAAIIISETMKVGVDVEVKSNKVLRILGKYLSEAEQNFLDRKFKTNHALICWAAKECGYKMFATPGISFTENMRVKPFRLGFNGTIIVKLFTDSGLRDYTLQYEQHADFVLVYGAV